jgi:hypothetical protein
MSYSFEEHKHRFAVWAAARSVQRGFACPTKIISKAIDGTDLRKLAFSKRKWTHKSFDEAHALLCEKLTFILRKHNGTYGRAAKIVAIYLKTTIIMSGRPSDSMLEVIHPPLDGILLKNLAKQKGLSSLRNLRWTSFSQDKYDDVKKQIEAAGMRFNWRLENYWKPELE